MIESAIALGVLGMFGFCLSIVCATRVKRLEKRLGQVERDRATMR